MPPILKILRLYLLGAWLVLVDCGSYWRILQGKSTFFDVNVNLEIKANFVILVTVLWLPLLDAEQNSLNLFSL